MPQHTILPNGLPGSFTKWRRSWNRAGPNCELLESWREANQVAPGKLLPCLELPGHSGVWAVGMEILRIRGL